MEQFDFDVVIVGGGPAGCTCALYTARSELKTVILDKNPAAGALAITHKIANYPGVPGEMSGDHLLEVMRDQAVEFGTVYRRAQVYGLDLSEPVKKSILQKESSPAVPWCSPPGRWAVSRRFLARRSTWGGGELLRHLRRGILPQPRGGGGRPQPRGRRRGPGAHQVCFDGALDHSQRPHTLDGHADDLLAHPSVKLWEKTRLIRIKGEEAGVTAVEVRHPGESDSQELAAEGVFVYLQGSKPITDFVAGQVEMKPDGGVWVDEMMQTSVPGVWAIGDIRNTPFKQAVVAAGDGCIAAMAIDRFLNSRKAIKPDWAH